MSIWIKCPPLASEQEPEPGNTTMPDSTTEQPDTTTQAATETTTFLASEFILGAYFIFKNKSKYVDKMPSRTVTYILNVTRMS